ncbi:hypothetical protein [Aureispira sp. CCB-QB1]|uniref:hypothetical protein n=1 Tax=Aureispira sp. CCB-QB1 TaxID=1313421 RepID=UPI000695A554|nr:hypothetical protein [Aureispira sp. CCB-QB1]
MVIKFNLCKYLVVLIFTWIIGGHQSLYAQKGSWQRVMMEGGLTTMVNARSTTVNLNLSDTLSIIQYYTKKTFTSIEVDNDIIKLEEVDTDSIYEVLGAYSKKEYNSMEPHFILKPYQIIRTGKLDKKYPFLDFYYITKQPNEAFSKNIEEEDEFTYIAYYQRLLYANNLLYILEVSSNKIKLQENTKKGNRIARCQFKHLIKGTKIGGDIVRPKIRKLIAQEQHSCSVQKKVLEQYFYWNDYKKTIDLLKKYEPCYKDKKKYNLKLGLLYHKTHQKDLAKLHCEKYLEELSKGVSKDILNCKRANVYLLLGLEKEMKAALKNVREDKLGKKEKEMFNYMNSIENIPSIGFEIESLFD